MENFRQKNYLNYYRKDIKAELAKKLWRNLKIMLSKTNKIIKRVAFFGDAEASVKESHFKEAFNCAKILAENGYIIVNGGGPGIMLAATKGAKKANGKVEIVILNPKKEPKNYEGLDRENKKLADKIIMTNNYQQRLNKIVEVADAFIIFKGGTGTLSEVGLTWELAKFEYGHHEPLIFYGRMWEEILNLLKKKLNLDIHERRVVYVVEKPIDALIALKGAHNKSQQQLIKKPKRKKGVVRNFLSYIWNN
jgi:uncharacterized protein (TIGR00725 family)